MQILRHRPNFSVEGFASGAGGFVMPDRQNGRTLQATHNNRLLLMPSSFYTSIQRFSFSNSCYMNIYCTWTSRDLQWNNGLHIYTRDYEIRDLLKTSPVVGTSSAAAAAASGVFGIWCQGMKPLLILWMMVLTDFLGQFILDLFALVDNFGFWIEFTNSWL